MSRLLYFTLLLLACLIGCCPRCASAQSYGGRFNESGNTYSGNTWSQANGWTYVRPSQSPAQGAYESEQGSRIGDRKVDGSVHYNSGRITDVPVGDAKLYLTVIVGTGYQNDPRQAKVLDWFQTDPRLNRLMGEMHFNVYGTDNPHFRERIMGYVGEAVPIVMIQRPNGRVIMNVTAVSMPTSSGALADMVYDAVRKENPPPNFVGRNDSSVTTLTDEEDCPPDGCPPNKPPVFPQPNVNPQRPTIPEVLPVNGDDEVVGAVLFAVAALAIIFGVVLFNKRQPPAAPPSFL